MCIHCKKHQKTGLLICLLNSSYSASGTALPYMKFCAQTKGVKLGSRIQTSKTLRFIGSP